MGPIRALGRSLSFPRWRQKVAGKGTAVPTAARHEPRLSPPGTRTGDTPDGHGAAAEPRVRDPRPNDQRADEASDRWTDALLHAEAPDATASDPAGRQPGPGEAKAGFVADWLTAHGLEKSFGRRQVVKGVSLGLQRGEAVGLLGPNGAGKTTVFYMITGLIPADKGAIELDGYDIARLPMYRRARLGIGYLPQEPSIFRGMTVAENIRAVLEVVEPSRRNRREQLDALLEEFRIGHLRDSRAISLSGGERRRCEIARALASRPTFMLLDEPFAGIDPIAVGDIRGLVRHLTARGIGVLITDHNVRETLGLIDRAYIIHDGKVLMEGTAEQVVANESVRRHYLGEEFTL